MVNFISAATFAILGLTFWFNSFTARTQHRKYQWLRGVAICCWVFSLATIALGVLIVTGAVA